MNGMCIALNGQSTSQFASHSQFHTPAVAAMPGTGLTLRSNWWLKCLSQGHLETCGQEEPGIGLTTL